MFSKVVQQTADGEVPKGFGRDVCYSHGVYYGHDVCHGCGRRHIQITQPPLRLPYHSGELHALGRADIHLTYTTKTTSSEVRLPPFSVLEDLGKSRKAWANVLRLMLQGHRPKPSRTSPGPPRLKEGVCFGFYTHDLSSKTVPSSSRRISMDWRTWFTGS